MSFFDSHRSGEILNSLSKDMDAIDTRLLTGIKEVFSTLGDIIEVLAAICLSTPLAFVVLIVPLILILYLMQRLYIPTARQIRQLETETHAALLNHLSETLQGMQLFHIS